MAPTHLIVGLGNPGARYENTRHNVGYKTVERLAELNGFSFDKTEHKALTASGVIAGTRVLLAKPLTFMNLSGESIQPLMHFYKIPVENLLIACDDLDIPFGTLRIRKTGSSGGQNGMKSIIERIGTQNVNRIRIGIGRPPGKMNPADYVLSVFKGDDVITALELVDRAAKAAELWIKTGIDSAMNTFNGTGDPPKAKSEKAQPAPTPTDETS